MSNSRAKPVADKRFVFIDAMSPTLQPSNTSAINDCLSNERYVFIDALRGLAALSVLFFHLGDAVAIKWILQSFVPRFITIPISYGHTGVQIFFVISGFVIAHSLRQNTLTLKSVGNFALRRQIRLDLPYWFVLIGVLLCYRIAWLSDAIADPSKPSPSMGEIALNFVYLQRIFDASRIVAVSWTLCIEIQFYLFFILLMFAAKLLARCLKSQSFDDVQAALVFVTGCFSLAIVHFVSWPSWFIQNWFYFAGGALCYLAVRGRANRNLLFTYLAAFLVSATLIFLDPNINQRSVTITGTLSKFGVFVGLLTILTIYVVGIRGQLSRALNTPILQYYGRISYSLYLIHVPVLLLVTRVGHSYSGESRPLALLWFVLAILLCTGVAHLLFVLVERPSMKLAARYAENSHE